MVWYRSGTIRKRGSGLEDVVPIIYGTAERKKESWNVVPRCTQAHQQHQHQQPTNTRSGFAMMMMMTIYFIMMWAKMDGPSLWFCFVFDTPGKRKRPDVAHIMSVLTKSSDKLSYYYGMVRTWLIGPTTGFSVRFRRKRRDMNHKKYFCSTKKHFIKDSTSTSLECKFISNQYQCALIHTTLFNLSRHTIK